MTASARRSSGYGPRNIVLIGGATIVCTLALMALSYGNGQPSDNRLSLPLVIHIAATLPALPLGAVVLLRRKGDALHKLLGRIWAMLMLTAAISSFWFPLSFIHLLAVVVLVSIPLSLWRLRVGDITGHRRAMEGMYIGLVIAGLFAFLPGRFLGSLVFA